MIEHGIPLEPINRQTGRKYPFPQMRRGDSFFIPCRTVEEQRQARRLVQSAARIFVRREAQGARFASRQIENGVRCWRTA